MCKESGCKKQAHYNYQGEKKAILCGTHKTDGMVNVTSKPCIECTKIPMFNKEGEKTGLYCFDHKKDEMVYITTKHCLECKKQANFNKCGEKKGIYCATHKKDDMINVFQKTCLECKTTAIFNNEGETRGIYCTTHKKDCMINVFQKTCLECKTTALFNNAGETRGIYCATHKKDCMINVISRKCKHEGCTKNPSFNIAGEKKSMYCAEHRTEEMINVRHKTCIECNTIPFFNNPGEKIGLYCSQHKLNGMVHTNIKTCKSEWCSKQVSREKYDGYCLFCYMHMFPDKPVTRNYKTKEYAVVEYVKTKFPDFTWVADRKVSDGCSKRRPDLLLDLGYQIIVVEVDENQHTDYDCSCENKRTMELSQDLGHRPIVFIRFNPDEYTKNETNISSCWGVDKKGICVVKKSKKEEWAERLKCLEENINYWTTPENTTSKTVEIIQLYYDM